MAKWFHFLLKYMILGTTGIMLANFPILSDTLLSINFSFEVNFSQICILPINQTIVTT